MPELVVAKKPSRAARPPGAAEDFDWPRSEGSWWPWIARFLWSPAVDLHPSRRDALLSGWPEDAWSDPAILAHVSRHLLVAHGLADEAVRWNSAATDMRVALLPQAQLARLARRVGLALHGASPRGAPAMLDEAERMFVARRVPLYWRAPPVSGNDPAATGWHVLRVLVGKRFDGITRRFEWKTPLHPGKPAPVPGLDALGALTRKVLKEFEEPWCSLFATRRRPGLQIRLRG